MGEFLAEFHPFWSDIWPTFREPRGATQECVLIRAVPPQTKRHVKAKHTGPPLRTQQEVARLTVTPTSAQIASAAVCSQPAGSVTSLRTNEDREPSTSIFQLLQAGLVVAAEGVFPTFRGPEDHINTRILQMTFFFEEASLHIGPNTQSVGS